MIEDFHRHTVGVHDHDSIRYRFPALVPCSQPRIYDIRLSFSGGNDPVLVAYSNSDMRVM
jgi:hypothetical protein